MAPINLNDTGLKKSSRGLRKRRKFATSPAQTYPQARLRLERPAAGPEPKGSRKGRKMTDTDSLHDSAQTGPVVLSFAKSYAPGNTNNLSLLQFPQELYEKIQADPSFTMKFKGREGDEAVLVTEDKTYVVRKGETSNSQLLFNCPVDSLLNADAEAPDCNNASEGEVFSSAIANILDHYELQVVAPRLRGLHTLLAIRPYDGPDMDEDDAFDPNAKKRLSRAEIERMLQASPKEVSDELQQLGALEVDGKLCLMDKKYESNLMTKVLAAAVLLDIRLSKCSLSQFLSDSDLAGYPRFVLENFMAKYSVPAEKGCGESENAMEVEASAHEQLRTFDFEKLAVFRAEELLASLPSNSSLTYDEFADAWKTMLPSEATVDKGILKGRALVEHKRNQVCVKRFSAGDLSADPKTRFKQMFAQCSTWSKEDLLPFLQDVVGPGQTADQLLLKHTRLTRQKGANGEELRLYTLR